MTISTDVYKIDRNVIQTEKLLGKGTYGEVYYARWNKVEVVIKELFFHLKENFEKVTPRMMHPHIVNLFGITTVSGKETPALVMEYMQKGSLDDLLLGQTILPWKKRIKIAKQIAEGLAFLHDRKIIHCNLKSSNVLFDNQLNAKLSDFCPSNLKLENQVSTLAWHAPELNNQGKHTFKTNIYSLGLLFWALASRQNPYTQINPETLEIKPLEELAIRQALENGNRKAIGAFPTDCPDLFKKLIEKCWAQSPDSRPCVKEVLESLKELEFLFPVKPWKLDRSTKIPNDFGGRSYALVEPSKVDLEKVTQFYHEHSPIGYGITKVHAVVSSGQQAAFKTYLRELSDRSFNPNWGSINEQELEKNLRRRIYMQFLKLSKPYNDSKFPRVEILSLWHRVNTDFQKTLSTRPDTLGTDKSVLGEGIYFTHNANHPRLYQNANKTTLLLSFVAVQSVFPVLAKDQKALYEQENFTPYDGRYIWVKKSSSDQNYRICDSNDKPEFVELMVQSQAVILPAFIVELEKTHSISVEKLTCPCNEDKPVLFVAEKRADEAFVFGNYAAAIQGYKEILTKGVDPLKAAQLINKIKRAKELCK